MGLEDDPASFCGPAEFSGGTLPKTNSSHLNIGLLPQKETKIVFFCHPFSGANILVSVEGMLNFLYFYIHPPSTLILHRTKLLKPMQLPTAMRGIGPATSSGKKKATVVLSFP